MKLSRTILKLGICGFSVCSGHAFPQDLKGVPDSDPPPAADSAAPGSDPIPSTSTPGGGESQGLEKPAESLGDKPAESAEGKPAEKPNSKGKVKSKSKSKRLKKLKSKGKKGKDDLDPSGSTSEETFSVPPAVLSFGELSATAGITAIRAKGLLFNPSDLANAAGTQWNMGAKIFPFSKLGSSVVYSILGFYGRIQRGQTSPADIKDGTVGEKVGSYLLKQQELEAGIVLRLALRENHWVPYFVLSPLFSFKQTPTITGPLSTAAVLNFDAHGLATSLGVFYRSPGAFGFDVNFLYAGSMQGRSTNVSIDEITSTVVTLQKASVLRISERTTYHLKYVFFLADISYSAFDVTIPHDDIPSRNISQKTTGFSLGVGSTF